ncbi:GNAT family N-acetyltransferase [Pseudooceanicola sp. 216_PA32_1]|uniref:GNAT family N-acetyltransferase n=1 Tax=Pseudooceanicola pacificus TaxID=2676438 RepID=A0A844WA77_9RHOB|nr:GNAT family N-acetyltransferase [Pseudooceanicola pacificus]MWB76552.1 GNAT family N-acetyltransferase [Pseudooceanicola pacificus]
MTRDPVVEILPRDYDAAVPGLTGVLHACVHAGASVNFILPFPVEEARAFWTGKVAGAMQGGKRRLWVAREGDRILGCVMLDWDTPPNQTHRAEVTKMLVHPEARRRGLARLLLMRLLQGARDAGKTLITLDTTTGSAAQGLYAAAGFEVAGSIPQFSRAPLEDRLEATTYMYRML